MSDAFGDTRTFPASEKAKSQMKKLVKVGEFKEMRDVWTIGASLGISKGEEYDTPNRGTFQNISSLDSDGFFNSIMFGLYPDLPPEERVKKIVNHAEWGINEIYRQWELGLLDITKLLE